MPASQPPSPQRWLILSHCFNMDGRAASQTITDKLPFLMRMGICPVVLSGVMGDKDTRFAHYQLLPAGPAGLRFDLRFLIRQVLPQPWAYRLAVGLLGWVLLPWVLIEKVLWHRQAHWSWALSAYLFGRYAIKKHGITCLYSTGGAYSAHVAALWLKRSTGLPLISEIHDPLVSPMTRAGARSRDQKAQARLEGELAQSCDLLWWFTQGALNAATRRHPVLSSKAMALMPGANPPTVRAQYVRCDRLRLGHFGSLSPRRNLSRLLKAWHQLEQSQAQAQAQDQSDRRLPLELHIYGGDIDAGTAQAAQTLGLGDRVMAHGRLEYDSATRLSGREQIMQRMQTLDVLVVTQGEEADSEEYIPSKLYEYFWAHRPVLGLTHANAQMDALLQARGCYVAEAASTDAIAQTLSRLVLDWQRDALGASYVFGPISVEHCTQVIVTEVRSRIGQPPTSKPLS